MHDFNTELDYDGIFYKEKRPSEIPEHLKEYISDVLIGPPPWTRFVSGPGDFEKS